MNLYWKLVLTMAVVLAVYGWVCPALVSSKADEGVLLGIIVAVVAPAALGWFWFGTGPKNKRKGVKKA